jgi:hypothetical protein
MSTPANTTRTPTRRMPFLSPAPILARKPDRRLKGAAACPSSGGTVKNLLAFHRKFAFDSTGKPE